MAISWTPPITWALDDVFNAPTLNQQIRDNQEYLSYRPFAWKKHVYGSNENVYPANVGWTHVPDLDVTITTETGRLLYSINLAVVDNNRISYWDVYIPELNIYLSSETSTPASSGLMTLQTNSTSYDIPAPVQAPIEVDPDTYTFQLFTYASAVNVYLDGGVAHIPMVREV